jgi:hypothetical protein
MKFTEDSDFYGTYTFTSNGESILVNYNGNDGGYNVRFNGVLFKTTVNIDALTKCN